MAAYDIVERHSGAICHSCGEHAARFEMRLRLDDGGCCRYLMCQECMLDMQTAWGVAGHVRQKGLVA